VSLERPGVLARDLMKPVLSRSLLQNKEQWPHDSTAGSLQSLVPVPALFNLRRNTTCLMFRKIVHVATAVGDDILPLFSPALVHMAR